MTDRTAPATRLAQALHYVHPDHGAVVPGIEPASTFARDGDYAPKGRAVYGRDGGPTTQAAEAIVADLDGATDAMLFASGMGAIVAVFETLRAGDHVVCPAVAYHGTISWLRRMEAYRGIGVSTYDASDPGALARALRPETRIVWVESPTNPNWEITDLAAAAEVARSAGARLIFDATCAPALTTDAFGLGADLVFQSATKYLNGHSDLTGGALSTRSPDAQWEEMRLVRTLQGTVLPAFEAWLLVRGMRTLHLRWARACESALAIARHFEGDPRLEAVLYPGLPGHPGHGIAARQMTGGFGGMLSLIARSEGAARRIATGCRVLLPATSLGGVESLIEHRIAVEPPGSAVSPALLRISVGIEDVADLIADLDQAIEGAQ